MSGLGQWLAAGGDEPLPEGFGPDELRQALKDVKLAFQALCGSPEALGALSSVGSSELMTARENLVQVARSHVDREQGLSAYEVALGRLAEDLIARDPANAIKEYQWVHQLLHGLAERILLGESSQEWDPPLALDWLSRVLQRNKTGQYPLLSIEQPNHALMQTIGAAGEALCAPEGMSSQGKVILAGLVIRAVNPEGGHPYISQLKKLGLEAGHMDALWSARKEPSALRNALSQHEAFERATFEAPLFRRVCGAVGLDTDLSRVELEAALSEVMARATDAAVLYSCAEIRSQGADSEALVEHIAEELGVEADEVPWAEERVWLPSIHRGFWITPGAPEAHARALLDGLQAELGEQASSIGGLVVLRIAKAELSDDGRSAARQTAAQLGQQDELVNTIVSRWKAGEGVAELPEEVSMQQLPVLSCEPGCEELSLELFGSDAGQRMLDMAEAWPGRAWEPLAIVAANRVASGVPSASNLQGNAGVPIPRGREMQGLWGEEWGSWEVRGLESVALVHIGMHMSPVALGDVGNDLDAWLLSEWERLMAVRMRETLDVQEAPGARAILEAWRSEAEGPNLDAGPEALVRGDQAVISSEVKRQLRLQQAIRVAESGPSAEAYSAARQRRRSLSMGHLIVGLVSAGLVLALLPIVEGAARLDLDSVEASGPGREPSAWPVLDANAERLLGPLSGAALEPAGSGSTSTVRMAQLVTWEQLSSLCPWPDQPSGPNTAEVGVRMAVHFIDVVNEIGPSRVFEDLPAVEGRGAWEARLPRETEVPRSGAGAEWLALERRLTAPVAQDVHTTEARNVSEFQESTGFRLVLEWSPN